MWEIDIELALGLDAPEPRPAIAQQGVQREHDAGKQQRTRRATRFGDDAERHRRNLAVITARDTFTAAADDHR